MVDGTCFGPGCADPTEWGAGPWNTRRRRYCSRRCQQRRWSKTGSKRRAVRVKERAGATLGRQCASCLVNDRETNWSNGGSWCIACCRQRLRVGTCRCGTIKRHYRLDGNKQSEGLCGECDTVRLEAVGLSLTILLAPEDDRERKVWRRAGEFPDVMTASKKQWKRLR